MCAVVCFMPQAPSGERSNSHVAGDMCTAWRTANAKRYERVQCTVYRTMNASTEHSNSRPEKQERGQWPAHIQSDTPTTTKTRKGSGRKHRKQTRTHAHRTEKTRRTRIAVRTARDPRTMRGANTICTAAVAPLNICVFSLVGWPIELAVVFSFTDRKQSDTMVGRP